MTIYDRPEETPGYKGLHGEVVLFDCYKLKELKFIPDVIFDFGANIGVFTRFARELFPNATIISVEPNETNYAHLIKFTQIDNWVPLNIGIGKGQLWHSLGAANGSGESYVSSGVGYIHEEMLRESERNGGSVEAVQIESVLPAKLIKEYVKPGQKYLVKIDIEGGEHAIFQDKESMKLLKKADYICAELHLYALHGGELYDSMVQKMTEAVDSFRKTHEVERTHVEFYATKK